MLSLFDSQNKPSRREWMRVGGLSLLGLNVADLARLRARSDSHVPPGAHQHNSCVFIFLFGGPSHIDLWDMKPDAPAEIRGEFESIATATLGIRICEHLPMLAEQMDKFCLLRSMTHNMRVHGPACSEIYSGRAYFGPPITDQARPDDWPSLSAMVMRYGKRFSGLPQSVVLPWYTQFVGQDKRIAGQTGGRMGENWNPFLVQGDPSHKEFEVQGLKLPGDVSGARFARRRELHHQLDALASARLSAGRVPKLVDSNFASALDMIEKTQAVDVFDIDGEKPSVRERYGSTKFGQSLLLARRLVENGVSLTTVNWDDDTKFDKVSPHWDTHHKNFPKLKDGLCPTFDRAFSAFLDDLHQRGLLETTLVVVLGEFGRTPKIGLVTQNGMTEKTGRDHWPHAFTVLTAGGGVRGGQAYGSTNSTGGYVADKPVTPADLTATVLHHLGIDQTISYFDEVLQEHRPLCAGSPVRDLG